MIVLQHPWRLAQVGERGVASADVLDELQYTVHDEKLTQVGDFGGERRGAEFASIDGIVVCASVSLETGSGRREGGGICRRP
jgi:hypothetical protein